MSFPVDLVLVRHGESEGNLAQAYSKKGEERFWTEEFKLRPTSEYRLTDKGRSQAQSAGTWLQENFPEGFDQYICSEYVRAMETASLLGLTKASWDVDFMLRERSRGALHGKSYLERKKRFKETMAEASRDTFFWTPPNGESMATACLRVDRFLDKLCESYAGFKVLVVCHGNIMEAFKILLEKMSNLDYKAWRASKQKTMTLHNGQILHYSRRSICPWDATLSTNKWEMVTIKGKTNADLLASVTTIKQLVNNPIREGKERTIKDLEARLTQLRAEVTEESLKRKASQDNLRDVAEGCLAPTGWEEAGKEGEKAAAAAGGGEGAGEKGGEERKKRRTKDGAAVDSAESSS